VENLHTAYVESFNKQDALGIAACYANNGILVNRSGPHLDIPEFYNGLFEKGYEHDEASVNQVFPFADDSALAIGEYRMSGKKNESGAVFEFIGRFTAVYFREGGELRIRMLSAFPKAPAG